MVAVLQGCWRESETDQQTGGMETDDSGASWAGRRGARRRRAAGRRRYPAAHARPSRTVTSLCLLRGSQIGPRPHHLPHVAMAPVRRTKKPAASPAASDSSGENHVASPAAPATLSPTKAAAPPRSPLRRVAGAISRVQKQVLLDNLRLESTSMPACRDEAELWSC